MFKKLFFLQNNALSKKEVVKTLQAEVKEKEIVQK